MKRHIVRIFFSIIFIGFILAIPAGQVFASLASVSASLDLRQFYLYGATWNPTSQTTSTNATASNSLYETGTSSDLTVGWVDSLSEAFISNVSAQGKKGLTGIPSHQALSATSQASLLANGWSSGVGSALLNGSFTFTAASDGWVTITVPYSVSMNLVASDDPTASAYGRTKASISLTQSGGSTSTDSIEFFSTVYGGNTYGNSKSGIFGLMKYFTAGETGIFRAEVTTEASASNPVPLPGALWFFGPGLACFFGLRRKFNK